MDNSDTSADMGTNRTVCEQLVAGYFCGCRDGSVVFTANGNTSYGQIPADNSAHALVLGTPACSTAGDTQCLTRMVGRVSDGTIACNCANKQRFTAVMDELVRPTLRWNETGQIGNSISNK